MPRDDQDDERAGSATDPAFEELHRTARQLMEAESAAAVAETVVSAVHDVLGLPCNAAHLYDESTDRLPPVATTPELEGLVGEVPTFDRGEGLAWEVFESGEARVHDDVSTVPGRLVEDTAVRSEMIFPLGDHGVLLVGGAEPAAFDERDVSLARTLAAHATTALDRVDREAELRAERTFIDQALDALDDVFYVVGPDGELRRWNDRLVEVTGYAHAEIDGMRAAEFFPPEERDRIEAAIGGSPSGGRGTVEADLLTADGERIPHEFTGTRLRGPDGEVTGVAGIGRDVTRRKENERALRRERERFGALFESIPEPVVHVHFEDGAPIVRNVNAAFEATFGHDAAELVGESRGGDIGAARRPGCADEINRRSNAGETVEREVRRQTVDGERTFLFKVVRADTGAGRAEAVGMYVDITERERRKRDLERYEALLEVVNDGVYVLGPDGRYTYVNSYAAEKTGYDREELIGATPEKILAPEAVERFTVAIDELLAGERETYATEVEVQPKTGEPYQAEVKITTLAEDGELERTVGVVRDVTERKEREQRLQRQNERLDRFASVVSHDLQNPLNVAAGYLAEAREDEDRPELEVVAESLDRMEALVDDLLALARTGQTVQDVEPVDLQRLAEECWGTVETAGATLTVDADLRVRADPGRLRQLLENLIGNAVEHAGPDVTVTVGGLDDGFYVADDGPGIPPDERQAVFESGYSTSADGTGFGLAIVDEIARAHDWTVSVTDDDGARFEFTGVETVE